MEVRPFQPADAGSCAALLDVPPVLSGDTLVATRAGGVVGFLTASIADGELRAPYGGAAVGGSADVAARLYAVRAQSAVEREALTHQVTVHVPSADLDAWYELSFGREQAYGVRMATAARPATTDAGVTIRPAGAGDAGALAPLIAVLTRHQQGAPVFSGVGDEFFVQLPAAVADDIASANSAYVVAEVRGRPVGVAVTRPCDAQFAPAGSVELSVVAVLASHRSAGVGSALVAAVLDAARGAPAIVCDWRTTNRLAARFWARWGFEPVAYRLRRTIAGT